MANLLADQTSDTTGAAVAISTPGTLIISGTFNSGARVVVEARADATAPWATVAVFNGDAVQASHLVNCDARATTQGLSGAASISVDITQ